MLRKIKTAPLAALLAITLTACTTPQEQPASDAAAEVLNAYFVDEIVAAERTFAADGYASGVKLSFLKWSAPDAVMLSPGPVNAHQTLARAPDQPADYAGPRLIWWPLYAGAAISGDLGFTTGPYAYDDDRRGYYFTVWRREADGGWKWVFDAGVGADASTAPAPGGAVAVMKPASRTKTAPTASGPKALEKVIDVEATLAAAARTDATGALAPYLAKDSRVHSAGAVPATTPDAIPAALAARPDALAFTQLGGGASDAGDMVWTYGVGRWRESGAEREGYYARIWRNQTDGWRIAFDEFIPVPGAPGEPASE